MQYRIKNWRKFQHFKNRTPPWIKLYRDILNDPEWHALPADAAKTLVMLWLVASESEDGDLPEFKRLAFRLRICEKSLAAHIKALTHYVYQYDITAISPRYQDDAPEGERETETEIERDLEPPLSPLGEIDGGEAAEAPKKPTNKPHGAELHDKAVASAEIPDALSTPEFAAQWAEFCAMRRDMRKYHTPRSIASMLKKLERFGADAATLALENSCANGYQGVFPEKVRPEELRKTQQVKPKNYKLWTPDDVRATGKDL